MLKTGNLLSVKYTAINPIFKKKEKRVTECVYDVTWTVQVDPPDEQHGQSLEAGGKAEPRPHPKPAGPGSRLQQDNPHSHESLRAQQCIYNTPSGGGGWSSTPVSSRANMSAVKRTQTHTRWDKLRPYLSVQGRFFREGMAPL